MPLEHLPVKCSAEAHQGGVKIRFHLRAAISLSR